MATVSEIKKVASALDSIAEAIEKRHEEFGIPEKVASDFAYRCDLLADCLDKVATDSGEVVAEEVVPEAVVAEAVVSSPVSSGGFSPDQIAKKVDGPLQSDAKDSETLDGEFTQEEFSSLLNLLKGLSEGDELVGDSDEEEDSEESESSEEDDHLAEQLQKVAAQLRARGSKK